MRTQSADAKKPGIPAFQSSDVESRTNLAILRTTVPVTSTLVYIRSMTPECEIGYFDTFDLLADFNTKGLKPSVK